MYSDQMKMLIGNGKEGMNAAKLHQCLSVRVKEMFRIQEVGYKLLGSGSKNVN